MEIVVGRGAGYSKLDVHWFTFGVPVYMSVYAGAWACESMHCGTGDVKEGPMGVEGYIAREVVLQPPGQGAAFTSLHIH